MKRQTILLVGLALVLGSIPVTSARHFSVGFQDDVGLESQEDRQNPSISDSEYERLTSTDCFDPEGELSQEEIQETSEADGACGKAVYHEGTLKQVKAAPDQDIKTDAIGGFDVIRSESVRTMTLTSTVRAFTGVEYCQPMCPDGSTEQPVGGDLVFDTVHYTGAEADLTENSDQADEKAPDNRGQRYAANTYVRSASLILQDTAGVWEMNGWSVDTAEFSFVAFLEDDDGNTISQSELTEIVQNDGRLDDSAAAQICAFSPNFELTTIAPGDAGTRCELPFRYRAADDNSLDFKDGYNQRCKSPTYVCGSDAAWYAEFCVCPGAGNTDYEIWHHVVAPHNSECGGQVEPNFDMDNDDFSDVPYLAHDLDVYTPPASANGFETGRSFSEVNDYRLALTGQGLDLVEDAVNQLPDLPGGINDAVEEAGETAADAETLVQKQDRLEPNNAEPVGTIDDTSRTYENGALDEGPLERSAGDECEQVFGTENAQTTDPWVDYLDSGVQAIQDLEPCIPIGSCNAITTVRTDTYGNADENQDDANRPGPSLYTTSGKVGMFTDKDDDGEFDQVAGGEKYEDQEVTGVGAYPMFWDMWLDDDGTWSDTSGCSPQDDFGTLSELMFKLGYLENTGLVQAIYLQEPTAFTTSERVAQEQAPGGDVVEYPGGNNIYLLMSQAARVQYDDDPTSDANPLDTRIDNLVDELKSYAEAQNGGNTPDVEIPGDALGQDSDFHDQCTGRTGSFDSAVQFVHDCSLDCSGDTIATMYTFELPSEGQGKLDGSATAPELELLPRFKPGGEAYGFGGGMHTWYDVDPFDNDPDRNQDNENPPPT